MRRLTRGVVVIAVLAIAVSALVVAWGDAPAVWGALRRFPPLLILPVVLLTIWNYTLRWLRWNYYLRVLGVAGVGRLSSALVFLSGFAMGLTRGKSGELSKSYWLREIAGPESASLARTAPIVFAERLVDGIAMLLLATSGLISFRFGVVALLAVAALACGAVALIQARPLVHAGLDILRRRPRTSRVAEIPETVYDSARELVNQATFALAAGSLVGSASLLPGGLGAAEGTVAGVLDLVARQPRDVAAAATLLIRVCTLWFGVGLGALALVCLSVRARGALATASEGKRSG